MQKADLKSLVTQMYNELLENIDSAENASKEDIVDYLKNATQAIQSINNNEIDSITHAKELFTHTYKEIAKESLNSYQNTNGKFQELSELQQKTLHQCENIHIDYPSIKEKFDSIQEHMNFEVQKANNMITSLSKQVKELEERSNLDALTKVFNRRALSTYLNIICDKDNLNSNLHLLILDIDDFKLINDTYGHIAGDKILIFIANLLRKTLRDGDKVFRYGGEEFIITLNRTEEDECQKIGNRILQLINSNQLIYKGKTINVTVSIGATQYLAGDIPDKIINRADKALYKSKHNGKNQMNTESINGN